MRKLGGLSFGGGGTKHDTPARNQGAPCAPSGSARPIANTNPRNLPHPATGNAASNARSPGAVLYRPSRPLPARSGIVAIAGTEATEASVEAVARQLAQATREPLRMLAGVSDWRALPEQWGHTPPRLIVLARGTTGLSGSDAIAEAAHRLRVPLLVLEETPQGA